MSIAPPFQVYLEVQALGVPYQASFQDLWVTRDDSLRLTGLDPGQQVSISIAGGPVARSRSLASGQAILPLTPPHATGAGVLTVTARPSSRRLTLAPFAGGDVYRLSR